MFEHSSNLLHGLVEGVQLNPNGILHAKIVIDEIVDKISLMKTRLGSSKARTSFENGPCIGPVASLEEMMMQFESFEKLKKEEIR